MDHYKRKRMYFIMLTFCENRPGLNDFEDFKKAGINSPYFEVLKKEWAEKYWQQLIQEQIASIEDTVKKYALYLSIDNKLSSLYAKQLTIQFFEINTSPT